MGAFGGTQDPPTSPIDRLNSVVALATAGPLQPGGSEIELTAPAVCNPHVISVAAIYAAAHIVETNTIAAQMEADARLLNARIALKEAQDRVAHAPKE